MGQSDHVCCGEPASCNESLGCGERVGCGHWLQRPTRLRRLDKLQRPHGLRRPKTPAGHERPRPMFDPARSRLSSRAARPTCRRRCCSSRCRTPRGWAPTCGTAESRRRPTQHAFGLTCLGGWPRSCARASGSWISPRPAGPPRGGGGAPATDRDRASPPAASRHAHICGKSAGTWQRLRAVLPRAPRRRSHWAWRDPQSRQPRRSPCPPPRRRWRKRWQTSRASAEVCPTPTGDASG